MKCTTEFAKSTREQVGLNGMLMFFFFLCTNTCWRFCCWWEAVIFVDCGTLQSLIFFFFFFFLPIYEENNVSVTNLKTSHFDFVPGFRALSHHSPWPFHRQRIGHMPGEADIIEKKKNVFKILTKGTPTSFEQEANDRNLWRHYWLREF